MSIAQKWLYIVDADHPTAQAVPRDDLYQDDANANDVLVRVVRNGAEVPLSGYSVEGEFERADGHRVPCTGTIEGATATVVLNEHCYIYPGSFELRVILTSSNGTTRRTILHLSGAVRARGTGAIVDINESLVDVDAVLALYDDMIRALRQAQEALAAIDGLTVSAVEGTTVGATLSTVDGAKHIAFRLPKGPKGDTGESQPHNWLINSDWREPVRVNSETSHTGNGYWLLGWKGDNSVSKAEIGSGYVTISGDSTSPGGVSQYIAPSRIASKTMTLVVYMADGNVYKASGNITTALGESVAAGDGFIRMSYESNVNAYRFRVYASAGKSLRVKAIALYEGALSVAPRYEAGGGGDLIEQARQFIVSAIGTSGYCTSTAAYIRIPIPVKMRAVPTLTNVNLGSVRVGGKNITPTSATINGMDDNGVRIALSYAQDESIINQVCAWTGSCSLNAYVVP